MRKLTNEEMYYLVSGGSIASSERLTKEQLTFLDSLLLTETDHLLYMDNHGVNIHLCAFREKAGSPLVAFLWGSSSEEQFFGDDYFSEDEVGPFEVSQKEVKAYEYEKTDGSNWQR